MIHENFIKNTEQESLEFKSLMSILKSINMHADEGRKLLCLINHILDFYILRDTNSNDDIKMPILYFPLCEEWAQFLCEEFVALKMSLLWGKELRSSMVSSYKDCIILPENPTKKERYDIFKQHGFQKNVKRYLTDNISCYESNENEKCFIYSRNIMDKYCKAEEKKGNYHFSHDVMDRNILAEKSLILLGENEHYLYDAIEKNDGKIKFPNIFLFLQKNVDGRHSKFCMQMQRSTINEYNQDFNTGIRNVFFIAFSQKPYRLQQIFENKHNLVERLQREKISETRDFVSFTKAEMDFLFNRREVSVRTYELNCKIDSEQHQIKSAFDFMLQDIPHEVKLRNELAICFTSNSRTKMKEEILEQNPEANDEYIDYFMEIIKDVYKNQLTGILFDWINFHQIAVVLDYNIESYYKNQLMEYLQTECGATSVKFYTFKNFKAFKEGEVFQNSIYENKILVLSMLNHCTGRNWAIYPNSFDQYHLNPLQSVLQINNKIVFDPRFSWYQYHYAEQLKLLLNSDYRTKYVKSGITLPEKPIYVGSEPKDDEDEQNARNCQPSREQNRVLVSFDKRQHRTFDEDEMVVCKCEDSTYICTIFDILRDFDDPTVLMIQPLVDFYQPLEIIIDNKERKTGDGELMIRNNPKYGLSDDEKVSKREMWKILLEHRVSQSGEQTVYNDIMKDLLPAERIKPFSFKRWLDLSEDSILPRSRRMQKRVIEEYLHIESIYTRMLRHRKSRITTNTEGKNSIFRNFLTHCLLEADMQKAYKTLNHEICDYLNIASGDDIKVIVDLVKEEALNVRQIKSIKYDQR